MVLILLDRFSGVIVTFGAAMSDTANRAALAFRAAVDAQDWPEVQETTMSLVSVFVLCDLVTASEEALRDRLAELLQAQEELDHLRKEVTSRTTNLVRRIEDEAAG